MRPWRHLAATSLPSARHQKSPTIELAVITVCLRLFRQRGEAESKGRRRRRKEDLERELPKPVMNTIRESPRTASTVWLLEGGNPKSQIQAGLPLGVSHR
jgi:hypothetical protein